MLGRPFPSFSKSYVTKLPPALSNEHEKEHGVGLSPRGVWRFFPATALFRGREKGAPKRNAFSEQLLWREARIFTKRKRIPSGFEGFSGQLPKATAHQPCSFRYWRLRLMASMGGRPLDWSCSTTTHWAPASTEASRMGPKSWSPWPTGRNSKVPWLSSFSLRCR